MKLLLDVHEWRTARPEAPDRAAHRRSWWGTGSKVFSSRYLPAAYSWWHRWKDPRRSSRQSSKQWPSSKRPFSHRRCWRQAAASAHLLLLQIRQPGRNQTLLVISKEFAGSLSDLLDNIHDLYIEDLLIQEKWTESRNEVRHTNDYRYSLIWGRRHTYTKWI